MNVQSLRELINNPNFTDDMQVYIRDMNGSEWTIWPPYVENQRVYLEVDMALLLIE